MIDQKQESTVNSNKTEKIHLTEIEKPSNTSKYVEIDARPVSVGQASLIPYKFYVRCPLVDGKVNNCPKMDEAKKNKTLFSCALHQFSQNNPTQDFIHEIPKDDSRIISLYKKSTKEIKTVLLNNLPCAIEFYSSICQTKDAKTLAVREAIFYPSAKIIEKGEDSLIDESGNPFRSQKLFSISDGDKMLSTTSSLKIFGKIHAHPQNQVPTVSITESRNSDDDFRSFKLTPEIIGQLRIFTEKGLSEFAHALSFMTRIYDRDMTHLLLLLIFHSAVSFRFEDRTIKGTLEGLFIGDAGVGKTMILRTLIKNVKLGQFMTGSCSSRTGLSYSLLSSQNGAWDIQWGAYPLNDMGLLIIDEGQDIPAEDWEKLSVARSEGVLTVDRAARGEHPSRTRLIVSANPKYGQQVETELHPCIHAKKIFTTKDIRRFDFAQSLSLQDAKKDNFLISNKGNLKSWLNPELLRNSVLFAWSRKSENIIFQDGISNVVIEMAGSLYDTYHHATDIPFVGADIKDKVLRLAVAHAIANHKVDETGENIIVSSEDVIEIAKILNTIYSNYNFGLKSYSSLMREETGLTEQEYLTILNQLFPQNSPEVCKRNGAIMNHLMRDPEITGQNLGINLDFDRKTIAGFMEPFKRHGLITAKRGAGYKTTRKFNKWMTKLQGSGYDLTNFSKI